MLPRQYQLALAKEGYDILREHMICYLAMEERTGKTLTAVLIADMCKNIDDVLVITKKGKPLDGWNETIEKYQPSSKFRVTNYHQAHKVAKAPDLLILDEAHNYISGCPQQPVIHRRISRLSKGIPIIYLSATPHAQGYQMLYHQFSLSSWSPFKKYRDFYEWFAVYGIEEFVWAHGKQRPIYTVTFEEAIKAKVDHLFIRKTRKELDFIYEPKDVIHYIELGENTRAVYNDLMTDKMYEFRSGDQLVCDSPMKLRTSLHMLEGGAAKILKGFKLNKKGTPKPDYKFLVLGNTEKIDYIKKIWGDTDQIAIYYQYIAEGIKLNKHFKKALILQATSHAEGIELSHIEHIIIYSQDFSTARHTQRRARQASQARNSNINVHFLLVEKAVSEQVYETVSVKKVNFVDSIFERELL